MWVGFEAGVVQCGPGTVGNSECATQSLQSVPTAPLPEVVEEVVGESLSWNGGSPTSMSMAIDFPEALLKQHDKINSDVYCSPLVPWLQCQHVSVGTISYVNLKLTFATTLSSLLGSLPCS